MGKKWGKSGKNEKNIASYIFTLYRVQRIFWKSIIDSIINNIHDNCLFQSAENNIVQV